MLVVVQCKCRLMFAVEMSDAQLIDHNRLGHVGIDHRFSGKDSNTRRLLKGKGCPVCLEVQPKCTT